MLNAERRLLPLGNRESEAFTVRTSVFLRYEYRESREIIVLLALFFYLAAFRSAKFERFDVYLIAFSCL